MKNGIILCKSSTWSNRLDIEYLDETSKTKQAQQRVLKHSIGGKLRQFVDYASKEELGQVFAGGFFHFAVCTNSDGSMCSQASLTNIERKQRIVEAWSKHLQTFPTSKVIQRRLVFSMSREFYEQLVAHGINPDQVLVQNTQAVLRSFQERFHKGDSIGYAYGIHHDTDHVHIHVAICPRTLNGAYIGLSKPKVHSNVSGHKDQHGYLIRHFARLNEQWTKALRNPLELFRKLRRIPTGERILFAPKLTAAKLHEYLNSRNSAASELAVQYQRIVSLETKINEKRAALAARRSARNALFLAGVRTPRLLRRHHNQATERDREELQTLRSQLWLLRQSYFEKYKSFQKRFQPQRARAHGKSQRITTAQSAARQSR